LGPSIRWFGTEALDLFKFLKNDRELNELRARNAELERAAAKREKKIGELEEKVVEQAEKIRELATALEEAMRAQHRQASPFRRTNRKDTKDRKKPGRKNGHPGSRKKPPEPNAKREAPKPDECPNGKGHRIGNVRRHENIEIEVPRMEPTITANIFWSFDCLDCGATFQATHPDQISTATGAASVHLGPQARALLAEFKYSLGLPYRKSVRILRNHFGVELTPGGASQANAALGERAGPTVDAIIKKLAESFLVHADETGWWSLAKAWLWVIANEEFSVYRVSPNRKADLVQAVLGDQFKGYLMRDGMASYDKQLRYKMLRCLRHIERNLEPLEKSLSGQAKEQVGWLLGWISAVWAIRHQSSELSSTGYLKEARELVDWFDWFTSTKDLDPELANVQKGLAKARHQIIPYVMDPNLPATNNLAERQVRPAVIIRKISGGTRSQRGTVTFENLSSIAASAAQLKRSVTEVFAAILRAPPGQPVPFWT
jgi:transposase